MTQPDYHEPKERFDLYSVINIRGEWHAVQIFKDLSWLAAECIAGIDQADFCQSIEFTGWVGSCPEWCGFRPIVTVPRGDKLKYDHAAFLVDYVPE